ncbi:MAG: hypothetical protein AB1715_09020 [Acidobacteriota bacterium]
MDLASNLRKSFRAILVANGALIASLLIYALVIAVVRSQWPSFRGLAPAALAQTLRYVFYGLGVVAVVLVRLIGRSPLKPPRENETPLLFIQRLGRSSLLAAAVAEVPAVLGFILFFLTGSGRDFFYLLFVSLFLEFMFFPRISNWEALIRERFPQSGI